MTITTASLDLVQRVAAVLDEHHACHLLPGVVTTLAARLDTEVHVAEAGERRRVDLASLLAVAGLLESNGRLELLRPLLLAVAPWMPVVAVPAAGAVPVESAGVHTVRDRSGGGDDRA